jgi:hypothetical protein
MIIHKNSLFNYNEPTIKLNLRLGMPPNLRPSIWLQLAKVNEISRNFDSNYYEKILNEDSIMED